VEIPHDIDVGAVLKVALQQGTKIASLNPVKMSLEDYFMAQVASDTQSEMNEQASISAE
jgi:hypothetical protein